MTLLPMHAWHPVAVHLPLVAFLLAAAFDLVASLRPRAGALTGRGSAFSAAPETTSG
jgi:uncharacterized membrane protein